MKKRSLVIIPARGGSRGIKNKNIIDVCGKPLIAYTIEPALRLQKNRLVDDVIISTDSRGIADIAQKLGANVPFLRPRVIAGDYAKSVDFILHALDFYEKKEVFYDYVIVLQPTSPLRLYSDIQGALRLYMDNKRSISLISVYFEEGLIKSILYAQKKNKAIPLLPSLNQEKRRQDAQKLFIRNGAIYISSVKYIKKCRRIISNTPLLFEMPKSRSLNIDTQKDLKTLRKILCK